MGRKVNIIGGGIAGLTAACYLQMNGFQTEVFESGNSPGGLCTSWKRGEYTINGCLHWLVGSNPEDPLFRLWNEIIDMGSLKFFDYDEFFRVRDEKGKEIIAYTNLDRLRIELLEKAPEDEKLIEEFIRAVRRLSSMNIRNEKAPELFTFFDKIKQTIGYFPYLRYLVPYQHMRIRDFAAKCRNPLLAKMFEYSFESEMPILFVMITFGWLDKRTAGYPIGGSLEFSRLFERRLLELGGQIHYGCEVSRILTEETKKRRDRACGLELKNGAQHYSDITISAADAYSTIHKLLDGKYRDDRIDGYFTRLSVFPSLIQISLGVSRTFNGYPKAVAFPLDEPFQVDPEKTIRNIYYRIYSFDPTLAPEGKTIIQCMIKTFNGNYWDDLRKNDREKYEQEKQRIADFYIDHLDKELGGIRENLEMVDVATPATVIRYTHNWKGSYEGWLVTKETGFKSLPKDLPGLDDFYLTGHWVEPGGGVPSVFFSSRNLVQLLKKKYK